jgi:hypothetical protein
VATLHEDLLAVLCAFRAKFAECLSGSTLQRRIKRSLLHPVCIPEGFMVFGVRKEEKR